MMTLADWCAQNNAPELLQCYLAGDNPIPPDQVGFSSGRPVRWKCGVCGLSWELSPNQMNYKVHRSSLCPFCSHERPSGFHNAAVLYPELLPYWDTARNRCPLEAYLPGSHTPAHWSCPQGHTWTRSIREQVRAVKLCRRSSRQASELCPYCSRKRVSPQYNLEVVCPEVAKQWCYSKNGTLIPRNISPYNQKKVFWQCSFDPTHIWADRISNRTVLLRGCPICSKKFRISFAARAIYYYLHHSGLPCACEVPAGRYRIDIEIRLKEQGSPPIALEIDGYRHRAPEAIARDRQKTAFLQKSGYRVVRVRESDSQQDDILVDNDEISHPPSDRNFYLDRVIQTILLLLAGIDAEPDHVRDHWKIEEFYYHTRREQSLAVQYPELAGEWSGRNPDSPETMSPGSGAKRWWNCPVCGLEYQATVSNRTLQHSGCPFCSHLRPTPETCLAAVFPEIASQWDHEKNAPLTPEDVLPGTSKRVWWKCDQGHTWQTHVYSRTGRNGTGCPYCQGRFVSAETSLAATSPDLAGYWHPTKNTLAPTEVAPHSNLPFWWLCPRGHEWQAPPDRLQDRSPDRVCPYCSHSRVSQEYCLAAQNKDLAALWHPSKNACTAEEVAPYSNQTFWWLCRKAHEWQESVNQAQSFGAEKACPYCNDRRVWSGNSLARLAPHLVPEWHPEKNLPLTPETVFPWRSKKIWWRCPAGHEWQAPPAKRYQRGDGCPYCSGHRASPEHCLAAAHPELICQWDEERNAPLTPDQVTPGSGTRVWWKCSCGHRWQSTVAGRLKSKGCPVCHRRQIRHQSLAQEHPELLDEWDASKNDRPPEQYTAHSNKKVWWRCKHGHEWQATPDTRSSGHGCPVCARQRRTARPANPEPSDPR